MLRGRASVLEPSQPRLLWLAAAGHQGRPVWAAPQALAAPAFRPIGTSIAASVTAADVLAQTTACIDLRDRSE